MSKGIDVSHNNGVIDWQKVKAAGIDFAMIRTGFAQTTDRQFAANVKGAIAAGLPIGIYHFSYAPTASDAAAEAKYCCSLLKGYKISLPVYFDLEDDSEKYGAGKGITYTPALRSAMAIAFCNAVKVAGYTPGIYTNPNYILYRYDWKQLKSYPLWLASWTLGADKCITFDTLKPNAVPTKYGTPAIWQIGKAKISGINTDTDINYGYMTLPDATAPTSPTVTAAPFKKGDKVSVAKYTKVALLKRGKTYDGGTFVIYRDSYDVMGVNNKRITIGFGGKVTAAVNADDLKKV